MAICPSDGCAASSPDSVARCLAASEACARCPFAVQGPGGSGMSVCHLSVWQSVQSSWNGIAFSLSLAHCPLPIGLGAVVRVDMRLPRERVFHCPLPIEEQRPLRWLLSLCLFLWSGAAHAHGQVLPMPMVGFYRTHGLLLPIPVVVFCPWSRSTRWLCS